MATPISIRPLAHVSTASSSPRSLRRRARAPESARKKLSCATCALSPPEWRESRRSLSFSLLLAQLIVVPDQRTLEGEKPEFAMCRSLLRSGPAASLRVDIRAVAQYASDVGNGKAASNDVDQCLRALEELDSLLLRASRNEPDASIRSMKAKIEVAVDALDSLLRTVPQDVLDKSKAAADAYRMPRDVESEILDPEIKQLESIL